MTITVLFGKEIFKTLACLSKSTSKSVLSNNRSSSFSILSRASPAIFLNSESVIFSTEILKNIKKDIEFTHKKHWIKVLSEILIKNKSHNWDYTLSEYELYGNYLYKNHKNLIHEIKHKNPENFISRKVNVTSITGGKTKWLTFYQQVKGVDWPECENEEDFVNLPESIRKECIEIFNYEPKHHGGKPK